MLKTTNTFCHQSVPPYRFDFFKEPTNMHSIHTIPFSVQSFNRFIPHWRCASIPALLQWNAVRRYVRAQHSLSNNRGRLNSNENLRRYSGRHTAPHTVQQYGERYGFAAVRQQHSTPHTPYHNSAASEKGNGAGSSRTKFTKNTFCFGGGFSHISLCTA